MENMENQKQCIRVRDLRSTRRPARLSFLCDCLPVMTLFLSLHITHATSCCTWYPEADAPCPQCEHAMCQDGEQNSFNSPENIRLPEQTLSKDLCCISGTQRHRGMRGHTGMWAHTGIRAHTGFRHTGRGWRQGCCGRQCCCRMWS